LGLWVFDIWDGAAFSRLYEGEERRFMPRLLLGTCVAALKQRPLTMTDAFIVMDAKHGRTAAKYVALAESQGFLTKVRDSDGDKRKTLLAPTKALLQKFNEEMARLADDTRNLVAALAEDVSGLPETGAAEIEVARRNNGSNRHAARAVANLPFPPRNWSDAYYGPK
jgi:hypothetical protein